MKKGKIAFFDAKPYDIESFDKENRRFKLGVKYFKGHLNEDTASLAKGFETVCAFVNDTLNENVINTLYKNGTRLIAMRCAGYNNVDLKSAKGRIKVVRVPAYSPYAVAEHTAALILSLNRKIHRAYYRIRDNNFSINGLLGFDLHGKTAGVVGTGKIGRLLIDILKGFGMNILAYDYYPDDEYARQRGITYVDLETLYKGADIISLHCPLTPETYHMINETSIASMKEGVMIINTGRGALIDTKALITGLKTGKIGSAGLDVYEEESDYFFEDLSSKIIGDDVLARLMTFSNVLITSHQAFFTEEALKNIADTTFENIQDFYDGKELKNQVCYQCG